MTALPLRQLLTESLTLPRAAARRVIGFEMSYVNALLAGLAVTIAGVLLGVAMQLVLPAPSNPAAAYLTSHPLAGTIAQAGAMYVMAFLIALIGGWFGGTGGQTDALKLMVWMQAVLVVLQAATFVLSLALPLLGALAGLAAFGWFFWALIAFIMELHGFRSALKTLGGVFISFFVIIFILAIVLTILGVQPPATM